MEVDETLQEEETEADVNIQNLLAVHSILKVNEVRNNTLRMTKTLINIVNH